MPNPAITAGRIAFHAVQNGDEKNIREQVQRKRRSWRHGGVRGGVKLVKVDGNQPAADYCGLGVWLDIQTGAGKIAEQSDGVINGASGFPWTKKQEQQDKEEYLGGSSFFINHKKVSSPEKTDGDMGNGKPEAVDAGVLTAVYINKEKTTSRKKKPPFRKKAV